MNWTPVLDDVDRTVLERLVTLGRMHVRLGELLADPDVNHGTTESELLERMEILAEAGLVRRVHYYRITEAGVELIGADR